MNDVLKVLVADDDEVMQFIYREGLSQEGFELNFAGNGREALLLYQSWEPHLVVLDIQMPEMSGYMVLKKIRSMEQESGRRTAVVMATSLADKSDIMDCARVGIQGYVIKPVKSEEIATRLAGYYQTFIAGNKHA